MERLPASDHPYANIHVRRSLPTHTLQLCRGVHRAAQVGHIAARLSFKIMGHGKILSIVDPKPVRCHIRKMKGRKNG
jgi:hypothetical protein